MIAIMDISCVFKTPGIVDHVRPTMSRDQKHSRVDSGSLTRATMFPGM